MIKNISFITLLLIGLYGCDNSTPTETPTDVVGKDDKGLQTFEERAKERVESSLQIPATENYTFKVYKSFINADTIEDAIITVNRMDFAMNEAIRRGNQAQAAEMGFMGNFNFFIYYDGAKDLFSVPIPVPSTPGRPLDISFQNITSPTRNDVVIDYRIRNSGWRSYFAVFNESDLLLVFQWKRFDKAGEEQPEAILHEIVDSEKGIAKDICIYTSEIDGYNKNIGDIYQYNPSITKKGNLEYRFYFDPKYGKYKLYSNGPGSAKARELARKNGR